jgi:hypothetical protein
MNNKISIFQLILVLFLNFNLFGQPEWTVNTAAYNLDGTIVASLKINDVVSLDSSDMVAAFDEDGNVRGIANLSLDNITNTYIAYLSVVSANYGDELSFKIYDASANKIFLSNNDPIVFVSNLDLGSIFNPYLVVSSEEELGVEKGEIEGFSFYPNPVSDVFRLKSNQKLDNINIYNSLGELIFLKEINSNHFQVDFSDFLRGVYYVKVESDNIFETVPIFKK